MRIIENQPHDTTEPLWSYFMTDRLLDVLNLVLAVERVIISYKNWAVAPMEYAQSYLMSSTVLSTKKTHLYPRDLKHGHWNGLPFNLFRRLAWAGQDRCSSTLH